MAKPESQPRASLPRHLRTRDLAQCRWWLRVKGIEKLKKRKKKKRVKGNLSCVVPQTSHSDPPPPSTPNGKTTSQRCCGNDRRMPINYQAKCRMSTQQSAAMIFTAIQPFYTNASCKSAPQLSPSFPQQEGGRQSIQTVLTPQSTPRTHHSIC